MTLRILFPHLALFPSTDASAIQVANMAQAFAELGHDVTLVAPAPAPDAPDPGDVSRSGSGPVAVPLHELLGTPPRFTAVTLSTRTHRGQSYLHAVRIARMARRQRVDLLFSRSLRACLIPALRGVPTVFEAHTLTALQGAQDRRVLRRLLTAPGFRGVVAISAALGEDLTSELGVPPSSILIAHDAVRLAPTATLPAAASTPVPTTSARPDDRLQVGYTGSLFAGRGVELLLTVAARSPWLTLHLVGGPASAAGELRERLAADPGHGDVVVHGPVPPMRARELQRGFDVLVAPFARRVSTDSGVDSSRWMSPMKVFEYMASGRPIVISDLPVLREVLRPDVDALMVPPEDADALVAALRRLADDPQLGATLAASALDRARREFTWEGRARRILERYVPTTPDRAGA